jgi:hypothetical protein
LQLIEVLIISLTVWRANQEVYCFLHIWNFGEGQVERSEAPGYYRSPRWGFTSSFSAFKTRSQAVRWYVTYKLSYRDVCDLMAERGVTVVHTTVLRWVQRFVPAFEKKWKKYARPVGSSWRVDETYIKVKGKWHYPYRAVDKQGQTVDFLLG